MKRTARLSRAVLASAILLTVFPPVANAAPNLNAIRAQIRSLQEQAATAGEAAQAAQVQLDTLNRTLNSVGLSQSMELLFSSNPSLYLASAGSLDAITKRKALQLRQFSVAKQRLDATSLTVNDKLALVKAAQARYQAQKAAAQARLADAQKILNKLNVAERKRLAALVAAQENADHKKSVGLALKANLGSGRGAAALRFAIKQMGDFYVFGAAGPIYWDCSGLTMRAFGAAGVSLPHSAAAQFNYGRYVPSNQLRPGDLVFFGRPISHVGIYLGGGRMVNAPHPGARVKVESFGSSFGYLSYVGARRI